MTLLEAQLHLELIDPDHVSKISGQRLREFNRLLSQQLGAAKAELRSLQDAFRMDYDLPHGQAINAQTLHLVTQRRARELRAHIQQQKRFPQNAREQERDQALAQRATMLRVG